MRIEGWEKRFSDFLKESKGMSFRTGKFDCVLFAMKCYEKITGVDHYSTYVYKNKKEAIAIINKAGSLETLVSKHLGPSDQMVKMANRGDICLAKIDKEYVLGVIDDSGQKVAIVSANGYARYPLSVVEKVWRYG